VAVNHRRIFDGIRPPPHFRSQKKYQLGFMATEPSALANAKASLQNISSGGSRSRRLWIRLATNVDVFPFDCGLLPSGDPATPTRAIFAYHALYLPGPTPVTSWLEPLEHSRARPWGASPHAALGARNSRIAAVDSKGMTPTPNTLRHIARRSSQRGDSSDAAITSGFCAPPSGANTPTERTRRLHRPHHGQRDSQHREAFSPEQNPGRGPQSVRVSVSATGRPLTDFFV